MLRQLPVVGAHLTAHRGLLCYIASV